MGSEVSPCCACGRVRSGLQEEIGLAEAYKKLDAEKADLEASFWGLEVREMREAKLKGGSQKVAIARNPLKCCA